MSVNNDQKPWDINGRSIQLQKGELGFTVCGTPVIYRLASSESISNEPATGDALEFANTNTLDPGFSEQIFSRRENIHCIRVGLADIRD
jgi:hypothetical protein